MAPGAGGRPALLDRAYAARLIPERVEVEFVG